MRSLGARRSRTKSQQWAKTTALIVELQQMQSVTYPSLRQPTATVS